MIGKSIPSNTFHVIRQIQSAVNTCIQGGSSGTGKGVLNQCRYLYIMDRTLHSGSSEVGAILIGKSDQSAAG